jgi:hypothetical protein
VRIQRLNATGYSAESENNAPQLKPTRTAEGQATKAAPAPRKVYDQMPDPSLSHNIGSPRQRRRSLSLKLQRRPRRPYRADGHLRSGLSVDGRGNTLCRLGPAKRVTLDFQRRDS